MVVDERRIKMKKQFSFYKKKSFYIVLIVIFSILLVLDIGIGLFAPSMNTGYGNGTFSQMPGGMNFGDMQMPEGMEFPEGENPFGDGNMPSFEDMPSWGDGSNEGSMGSGSFPGGSFPGGSSQSGSTRPSSFGLLQTIKSNWVLFAIILAVLDGASIYMFLRIKKNEKNNGTPSGKGTKKEIPVLEDKEREYPEWIKKINTKWEDLTKKVPILKYTGKAALAGLLILVLVVTSIGGSGEAASQVKVSVYSGTVEKGDITKVVSGTGTLADEAASTVELPSSIEVNEWYVSNGDVVVGGQKLAQVDKVSVMSAIAEIQDKLDELDNELEKAEDETISETIKSNTDGKIKVIYAENGESVVDVMYEHGALMLISLDGMMAVSLATEEMLYIGDIVTVTTEDGTTLSGKVQSTTNGNVVITVSDDSVDYAEKVTVTTEEGVVLGTGEVYIHSELKVTGYAGIVSSVNVSVNEEVSKGKALLSLNDTEYKAEYETLLLERRELENMMYELIQINQDGYLYADMDGIVKGIDESLASSAATETSVATSGFSSQQGSYGSTGMDFGSGQQGSIGMDVQTGIEESNDALETKSVVSIVPQNKLSIAVTIDEMDILSVAVGQETEITLDAFPGQSFNGSVSSVDYNGTNSGGSTKYTVYITMDRGEDMLDGMNAAVSILVDKTEDILIVPVTALVEDESGVYVYTKYNEKKELFGEKVEVTTGVSDGLYVEILSGLEEGSEYWYSERE